MDFSKPRPAKLACCKSLLPSFQRQNQTDFLTDYDLSINLFLKNPYFSKPRTAFYQVESSTKTHFVILSEAKDLVFTCSYEILRSLRSLGMTGVRAFA